ncbi:MAG TPA: hypothetical protein VGP96_00670 [Candidatus Dormibacteraeota bacterium]|nr:hypothetical protein [Candidatus Dormibacteraeota bacterium]
MHRVAPLAAFGLAGALFAVAGIGLAWGVQPAAPPAGAGDRPSARRAASVAGAPDVLMRSIVTSQEHLRRVPGDWEAWAELGAAYIQEGRITVDPSYYPKAEGALHQSLQLQPDGNVTAMVGMGALASARHDFQSALDWAQRARAVNDHNGGVEGVVTDALTQLGHYPEARVAVQRMVEIAPGLASFSRASYDLEEHGDVPGARAALERALADAFTPADRAFARHYLGELAFNSGQLEEAARQNAAGLQEDPGYVPLLEGRARVEAAQGQGDAAVRDYSDAIARVPQPQYVIELGELQASLGHATEAQHAFDLVRAEDRLFAADGVDIDLEDAVFEADHGDPAAAVSKAQAEWVRRQSVLVADALGWALHQAGDDRQALGYLDTALALGWRNALMLFHRGMVERSLGMAAAARRDLSAALSTNPHFSVTWAPVAARALAALGGRP